MVCSSDIFHSLSIVDLCLYTQIEHSLGLGDMSKKNNICIFGRFAIYGNLYISVFSFLYMDFFYYTITVINKIYILFRITALCLLGAHVHGGVRSLKSVKFSGESQS